MRTREAKIHTKLSTKGGERRVVIFRTIITLQAFYRATTLKISLNVANRLGRINGLLGVRHGGREQRKV